MGIEWLSDARLEYWARERHSSCNFSQCRMCTMAAMAAELRVRRARTLNDESASQGSAANVEEPTDAQAHAALDAFLGRKQGYYAADLKEQMRAALVAAQDIKDNGDWSVAAHQVGEETP